MKISIDDQSIKLPIDRLKPIDDQSIIKILKKARLPIDYRKQSITNPSIGHRLVIDWKKLSIVSSGRAWFQGLSGAGFKIPWEQP